MRPSGRCAGGAVEAWVEAWVGVSTAAESVDSEGAPRAMARRRRHTRSAEAGGARVRRVVFFPAEREYRGGESREARCDVRFDAACAGRGCAAPR